MVDAEMIKKKKAEAEKESRLKAVRIGCGTPAWLVEAMNPNMEIEQYLGKKNRN